MTAEFAVRKPHLALLLCSMVLASLVLVPQYMFSINSAGAAASSTFSFGAAGDFGDITGTAGVNFQNLKSNYPSLNFVVLLGDLSYGDNTPEKFCGDIKDVYGFQPLAVTGNHDEDSISGYAAACSLPSDWSYTGKYFENYYIDWPQPNPIARFIATGAGTTSWDITFVSNAIDQAKSQGLWVFVFQHKDCISTGSKSCEVGREYMDLLLSHRVDVWLEGHDHNYQRSKQLSCAQVGNFEAPCVVDSGSSFSRGAGTVLVNSGTGGKGEYTVHSDDPEAGYFQVINDDTHGFSIFTVSSENVSETFLALDGPLQDSFTITSSSQGQTFDFFLSTSPRSATLTPGGTATVTVDVTLVSGTTQEVTISTSCPSAIGCSLAQDTGNPSFSMIMTLSALSSTPAGNFQISLTGTNGTISRSTTVTVSIRDFGLTANPANLALTRGAPATAKIIVTSLNDFRGSVALTTSVSTPAPPKSCIATLNDASITLGTSGSTTLTVTCSRETSGAVTITATGGATTHTTTVTFTTAPTFTLTADPPAISFNSGGSASSMITVAPANGFTGPVTLDSTVSPAGLTCTLNPVTINLGASQASTLSCAGSTATSFTVTTTGTSSTLSSFATVAVSVRDFTVTTSPVSMSFDAGDSGEVTVTVAPVNGFTGTVTLTSAVTPAGLTCTLTPTSVTLPPTPQISTLSCTSSAVGSYTVTVTGTNTGQSRTATVTVTVTDFALSGVTPVSGNTGVPVTSTITVTGLGGFAGIVALTDDNTNCALSPTSVTLPPTPQTSTLSCKFPSAGSFTIVVTGTNSGQSRTASVVFNIAVTVHPTATSVACTPTSVVVGQATSCTATVTDTLSTLTTPTGTVSWTIAGVTGSFSAATCTLSGTGASATCSVTFTATATGTAAITGSYGGDSTHSTSSGSANVTITNFTLAASRASVTVVQGNAAGSTITVTGVNGFTGTVTLKVETSPSTGLSCNLTPPSVTLGSDKTSTLTCTGSTAGDYIVTVTGTSGSMARTAESFARVDTSFSHEPPGSPPEQSGSGPSGEESSSCLFCGISGPGTMLLLILVPAGVLSVSALIVARNKRP